MNTEQRSRGSLRFSLFGIPTEIQPFSWILLGLLGLSMYSNTASPLQPALIFVVVGMLSLLAHEFGHALTARAFTKKTPIVIIGNLGGVTYPGARMPSRMAHFLYVLAGPMAGFGLGILAAIVMGLQIGSIGGALSIYVLEPISIFFDIDLPASAYLAVAEGIENGSLTQFSLLLYSSFFMICFWWTVFNLLPILPMDGGQLLLTATNKPKIAAGIGLALSALLAIWFVTNGGIFMTLLVGYFAWINWQILKNGF